MDQVDKDTSSGREIRAYECPKCGHSAWEDRGKALWQILSDARESDEAEKAKLDEASSLGNAHAESAEAKFGWSRLRTLLARFFQRKR
jgi:hypothetical protein